MSDSSAFPAEEQLFLLRNPGCLCCLNASPHVLLAQHEEYVFRDTTNVSFLISLLNRGATTWVGSSSFSPVFLDAVCLATQQEKTYINLRPSKKSKGEQSGWKENQIHRFMNLIVQFAPRLDFCCLLLLYSSFCSPVNLIFICLIDEFWIIKIWSDQGTCCLIKIIHG